MLTSISPESAQGHCTQPSVFRDAAFSSSTKEEELKNSVTRPLASQKAGLEHTERMGSLPGCLIERRIILRSLIQAQAEEWGERLS